MTQERERLGRSFDRSAHLYDEARPDYPAPLFADLIALSRIPSRGRILEIGCGTGQATLPLARRGYPILWLEPGSNLADIARPKLAPFTRAAVRTSSFEEWELEAGAFDLVVAAASFGWVDPRAHRRRVRGSGGKAPRRGASDCAQTGKLSS